MNSVDRVVVTRNNTRVFAALVIAAAIAGSAHVADAAPAPMRFGADIESLDRAASRGMALSYGTFWLGSWTQKYGWGYAQDQLRAAAARNVTPVIHWWYWGDDISPNCVENGCHDVRQGVWKDKATWHRMTMELADLVNRTLPNREVIVVLESEFNKGGIETYEPFDTYMAQVTGFLRSRGVTVVIGFGNWGYQHWGRFDQTINAASLLGVQLMRSSLRDASSYPTAIDTLVWAVQQMQAAFRKEIVVMDLALSSFPAASYEPLQAAVIEQLFARMAELKAAGVRAVLYRMLVDNPAFDTSNYHGEAERHWGLLRADGSAKPAFNEFVAGMQREAAAPPPPACQPPAAPTNFRFGVQGTLVTMMWNGAAGATSYVLEAGSRSGVTDLAAVELVPAAVQVNAPPGNYFVRARARNQCGVSAASNEALIQVR